MKFFLLFHAITLFLTPLVLLSDLSRFSFYSVGKSKRSEGDWEHPLRFFPPGPVCNLTYLHLSNRFDNEWFFRELDYKDNKAVTKNDIISIWPSYKYHPIELAKRFGYCDYNGDGEMTLAEFSMCSSCKVCEGKCEKMSCYAHDRWTYACENELEEKIDSWDVNIL